MIMMITIPMDVTLLGIVTDVREVHITKAELPYESNDVVMINNDNNNNNNNHNSNTNGCNTIRNSNGCQGGACIKGNLAL